jgi:AcrR family transcriptional regulator
MDSEKEPAPSAHRRSGRPARLTRDQIIDAAIALIAERGATHLSLRAVAARLGVSPMALYNHVASREDLERLIATRIGDERRARWAALGEGDWQDALLRSASFYQEIYRGVPALAQLPSLLDNSDWNFVGVERLLSGLAAEGVKEFDAIRVAHLAHLVYRGWIASVKPAPDGTTTIAPGAQDALDPAQFPSFTHASGTADTMDLSLVAAVDFLADLVKLLVRREAV